MTDAYLITEDWPWPQDTREERAKRIANSYRGLLFDITQGRILDPAGAMHRLDMKWRRYGINWHLPGQAPADPLDWVTAVEAALYADVKPSTIRKWAERGLIRVNRNQRTNRYNIGDINDLKRDRVQARYDRGTA